MGTGPALNPDALDKAQLITLFDLLSVSGAAPPPTIYVRSGV